jgi:hypothetical protein
MERHRLSEPDASIVIIGAGPKNRAHTPAAAVRLERDQRRRAPRDRGADRHEPPMPS